MDQMDWFWLCLAVMALWVLWRVSRQQRPLQRLWYGVLLGVLSLFPASFLLGQAGYALAINGQTIAVASVLGLPGTVAMALFCVFF